MMGCAYLYRVHVVLLRVCTQFYYVQELFLFLLLRVVTVYRLPIRLPAKSALSR